MSLLLTVCHCTDKSGLALSWNNVQAGICKEARKHSHACFPFPHFRNLGAIYFWSQALHGSAQAQTAHWHESICRLFGASHFSLIYYRKGNDRVLFIPQRACLYKNISGPHVGHFRLGNSRAMLIHVSKTLLSAKGSLFPSLRKHLIVRFYNFSSGIVHLVPLVSDRVVVANLNRITLVTSPPESSVCLAILD